MKVDYRRHMKKVGATIEGTALDMGISVRQMQRYINGEAPVPSDKVMALARAWQAAELPFEHLAHENTIGENLCPAPLNNIERNFAAFYYKAVEEQQEFIEALDEMCRLTLNGRLMDAGEAEEFDQLFSQVIDVEQLCLEIKIEYARIRGIKALEERIAEHRKKCITYGYHRDKGPALIKERARTQYAYLDYTTGMDLAAMVHEAV